MEVCCNSGCDGVSPHSLPQINSGGLSLLTKSGFVYTRFCVSQFLQCCVGNNYIKFGRHCICVSILNLYLYQNFIFLFYGNFMCLYNKLHYLKQVYSLLFTFTFDISFSLYANGSVSQKVHVCIERQKV